jgi:periplasmic protein TonB
MNNGVAEKRPLGALGRMGAVAGLHLAALYLIASSLGIVPSLAPEPPFPVKVYDDREPPDDPLPPIPEPRSLKLPPLIMETPDVPPDLPPTTDSLHVEFHDNPPVVPPVEPPTQAAQLVGVRLDARHPLTQPNYPLSDIRLGNEGAAEIEVYVLPSGRVGDARVVRSTGSPTLDQSAIEEAKRRWRLLPATRDGEPYAQWHRLKVVFSLKDR